MAKRMKKERRGKEENREREGKAEGAERGRGERREEGRRESRKGISEHKNMPPGVFWVFPDIVGGREGVDHPKRPVSARFSCLWVDVVVGVVLVVFRVAVVS